MVKKLGLTYLFTTSSSSSSIKQVGDSTTGGAASMSVSSSWQWPSCKQPRTLSFRQQQQAYKTMNSAYLPDSTAGSCFSTDSFASVQDSLSTAASEASGIVEAEAVVRGLRSDRLFFEPCTSPATSSLLHKASKLKVKAMKHDDDDDKDTCIGRDKSTAAPFEGATAMTVESSSPYRDFRASMEEMIVKSQRSKDWRWLEKMLGWYLRANGKNTHGLIVGAFVDLLVALNDTSASPSSPTTATNCFSCSACSSFAGGRGTDVIKEEDDQI